jgi:hypothetical protein
VCCLRIQNIGLQAKILSQRTFTIFVVMALVTTFATTPLTSVLFPPWYQKKLAAWKRGEVDWDGVRQAPEDTSGDDSGSAIEKEYTEIKRLLVNLRLDSLPSLFTFVALLGGGQSDTPVIKVHPTKNGKTAAAVTNIAALRDPSIQKRPLEVHGLRMLELTERLSSVMKDSEVDELSTRDPVVNAFHTFGQLNNVAVSGEVQLVPEGSYSEALGERASDHKSDMILVPWSETGSFSEAVTANMDESTQSAFSNGSYNYFVAKLLDNTPCNAAVLVNNGFGALPRETLRSLHRVSTNPSIRGAPLHATAPLMDRSHHIFFPFIGGMDDRIALRFVLRLAKNPNVTATIVRIKGAETISPSNPVISSDKIIAKDGQTAGITSSQEILSSQDQAFFASMADSLSSDLQSRILFNSIESNHSLQDIVEQAREEVNLSQENAGDLIVVGRQHGKHTEKAFDYGTEGELRHSLGGLAEAMIMDNVKASVLVIQAAVKVE